MNAPVTDSIRGFARRRGCAPSYVHRLVHAGTLPMIDGRIDVAAAEAILAKRADPGRKAGSRERKANATKPHGTNPASAPPDARSASEESFTARRNAKMELESALLQEKLNRERGLSVDRAAAERLMRDLGVGFGKMIERYPDRIATQIAAQLGVDPHPCRALLVSMAKELRTELAARIAGLPARMEDAE